MEHLGFAATVFGIGMLVFAWLLVANRRIANRLYDERAQGFFAVRVRFYHAMAGIVWLTAAPLGGYAYVVFALMPGHNNGAWISLVVTAVMFLLVVPLLIMRGVNLADKHRR